MTWTWKPLELLEEILLKFDGTLLLVNHDRAFLDNVITSCIVFEGQGQVNHYVGGYADWAKRSGSFIEKSGTKDTEPEKAERKPKPQKQQTYRAGKLSYMVQRELDALPEKIENSGSRTSGTAKCHFRP